MTPDQEKCRHRDEHDAAADVAHGSDVPSAQCTSCSMTGGVTSAASSVDSGMYRTLRSLLACRSAFRKPVTRTKTQYVCSDSRRCTGAIENRPSGRAVSAVQFVTDVAAVAHVKPAPNASSYPTTPTAYVNAGQYVGWVMPPVRDRFRRSRDRQYATVPSTNGAPTTDKSTSGARNTSLMTSSCTSQSARTPLQYSGCWQEEALATRHGVASLRGAGLRLVHVASRGTYVVPPASGGNEYCSQVFRGVQQRCAPGGEYRPCGHARH